MPSSVSVSGPNLQRDATGYFDSGGVARLAGLPPGPWLVALGYGRDGVWCRSGQPCELDLSSKDGAPRITLRGAVPKVVELREPRDGLRVIAATVRSGVIELSSPGPVVLERTTLNVSDGGVRLVRLAAPVDLRVKVVDSQQQPVSDALVSERIRLARL